MHSKRKEFEMEANVNALHLYEALELRAEYNARITTIKDCLAGDESGGKRASFWRDDKNKSRPSPDFDVSQERAALRVLEFKQRKLNSATQKANYETQIEFEGQKINLLEALELRKGLTAQMADLKTQAVEAAHQTVIYKEGRDIVEASAVTYVDALHQLETARLAFRELNRKLRRASFETFVVYQDEC
jgi:hypothetical protein